MVPHEQQHQELGHQTRVDAPFWETPASWREAEGEHKVGAHPSSLKAPPMAPVSVPDPKPTPTPSPVHRKTGSVFESVFTVLWAGCLPRPIFQFVPVP